MSRKKVSKSKPKESAYQRMKKSLGGKTKCLKDSRAELKQTRSTINELSTTNKRLQMQLQQSKSEIDKHVSKYAALEGKYAQLSEASRKLWEEYQQSIKTTKEQENTIKQLVMDIKIAERKGEIKAYEDVRSAQTPSKSE